MKQFFSFFTKYSLIVFVLYILALDLIGCNNVNNTSYCGNNEINSGEWCDGTSFKKRQYCPGQQLVCDDDCLGATITCCTGDVCNTQWMGIEEEEQ